LPIEGTPDPLRKLDIYNWAVRFIRPQIIEDNIRLASLEDLAAFKLDAICPRKEKKDYIDLNFLLKRFSFAEIMTFYQEKYPFADKRVVLTQINNVEDLDKSKEPVMMIKLDIKQALTEIHEMVKQYTQAVIKESQKAEKERDEKMQKFLPEKDDHISS
jgi:predicted nucleotidyltransferase